MDWVGFLATCGVWRAAPPWEALAAFPREILGENPPWWTLELAPCVAAAAGAALV